MIDPSTDWFRRRTYHHADFGGPAELARRKERQGVRVSVCIPTLNEAETIGDVVGTVRRELVDRVPLVDELVVIDSGSVDATVRLARAAGATVHQDREVLGDLEPMTGKGEALWKSLFVLTGDVIVWLDADVRNFDVRFPCGILGPLLTDPDVGFVKGFYERPIGDAEGPLAGGRVTELMARPLINMFWPHLAGLVQPLSGEYGGRRRLLEQVPFFTDYGVEMGLIIDVASRFGIESMAQVDLERRLHRNRELPELSRMAFAVLQVAVRRLESDGRLAPGTEPGVGFLQFQRGERGVRPEPAVVAVRERPPAVTVGGARGGRSPEPRDAL